MPPLWLVGEPAGCSAAGQTCSDGTVLGGTTWDGRRLYVTAADGPNQTWSNGATSYVTVGANSMTDGRANTLKMAADTGYRAPYRAAALCRALTAGGRDDWYLPARDELSVLYENRAAIGGFDTSGGPGSWYWASTEAGDRALGRVFDDSTATFTEAKGMSFSVRCVRR